MIAWAAVSILLLVWGAVIFLTGAVTDRDRIANIGAGMVMAAMFSLVAWFTVFTVSEVW